MPRVRRYTEQLIRQRVAQHPEQVWLKFKDSEITWKEVLSNIQRAANGLLDLGVRPRERVAIMMGNRPEFLWLHFAAGFIGAVSVPVNTSQRGATLAHILADSDCATVIFEEPLKDAVFAVRDKLPKLRATVVADGMAEKGIDWNLERLFDHSDKEPEVEIEKESGAANILYTSGTTGPPKGVVATGTDALAVATLLGSLKVQPGETMYTALPLFHGNALMISAFGSIALDAKLALAERFSASRFWDDCRRYEAVEFNALGAIIPILMKQPPLPSDREHQVRVVLSAACPASVWREFEQRFGVRIVEFYGMVDAPGLLLNDVGRVGSMGRPIGTAEFRVVDESDEPLPPGKVGELVFRQPKGQLAHYHNLPTATAEAYRGGWFHSGDLAKTDEEGFFYFCGRKKASIRRRGENISAWEIETVINQHPAVLESAAYAVPSELGEDEVKVGVVLRPGVTLAPEDLLDFCQNRMAYYALPRYVEFLDELPKTGTHRIQYETLRKRGVTGSVWDREKAGYAPRRT